MARFLSGDGEHFYGLGGEPLRLTINAFDQDYKVDESTAFRVIQTVEKNLIQHPDFQLPGKKVLKEERESALIIDVTESQIERPKKNRKRSTAVKRKDTH